MNTFRIISATRLADIEADKAFVARCHELGAIDTDIVKHALEDQARVRSDLMPLAVELDDARQRLKTKTAELNVLRGSECCVDGDGPCGVCLTCLRKRAFEEGFVAGRSHRSCAESWQTFNGR